MKSPAKEYKEIYTIGHSNHPWERFLELLREVQIEVLVDVRSSPYSRYAPHFNIDMLESSLRHTKIKYLYLGNILGGRPEGEEFYDDEGHVHYDQIINSLYFQEGMKRLIKGVKAYKVALFCGEEDPTQCHRRLLIGKFLRKKGFSIFHIRGDGRLQSEEDLTAEEDYRKHKGQLSLFSRQEAER